jgi:hypothetical protein
MASRPKGRTLSARFDNNKLSRIFGNIEEELTGGWRILYNENKSLVIALLMSVTYDTIADTTG